MDEHAPFASLVRAAQMGDDDAFTRLVQTFQDMAVAYAMSMLHDGPAAEDAAQEAFVEVYRGIRSLREPLAFPKWFRRIVYKHCDRITRRTRDPLAAPTPISDTPSTELSALERIEQRETHRALHLAISQLTQVEREVVLLYYMGERSQSQIAAFLDVTPNAIKTRLASARRRMRDHMSDMKKHLNDTRPSSTRAFTDAVRQMIQPEALKQEKPWLWSTGIGTDVWKMFCACMTGDIKTVRALIAKDLTLVRSHYEYRTPLSFAVRENQLAVAEFLLDHGAAHMVLGDPLEMAQDRGHIEMAELITRKTDELHNASAKGEVVAEAIRNQDLALVSRLLSEEPERIHAGDRMGNQPIHWAVMTRQPKMIDELLHRGADIDIARIDGARPIHLTNGDYHYRGWRDVPNGRPSPNRIYKHLVKRGATIDVWMAALKGDLDRVRTLIDDDPSLINRNNPYNSYYPGCGTPLTNAVVGQHLKIVRLLLDRGADPNIPEEGIAPRGRPLYAAVTNGNLKMARLLLEHGAYPNPPMESSGDAVWIAIRDGNKAILELLASHGAVWDIPITLDGSLTYEDIVATGLQRPLKILAFYGDVEAAKPLLTANPNLADDPEVYANAANHESFVRLLLEHNAEAAKLARVSRPRATAELLFAHGMDPNNPDWLRITPLHSFARNGDIESAACYIDHGADLELTDVERCSTPLAWAAEAGQLRMAEYLLRRGAKLRPENGPEWATPIAWAKRRKRHAMVELLSQFEKTGRLPDRTVEQHETLAERLVRAFNGDSSAVELIIEYFQGKRQLTWDKPSHEELVRRVRMGIRRRLREGGRLPSSEDALSLDDARYLIAANEGFASWEDLTVSILGGPST